MTPDPIDTYVSQVIATFADAAGRPVGPGVSVVPFDDRTSAVAVAYLLPEHTLIAASPETARRLAALDGDSGVPDFSALGGVEYGVGLNYVLASPPPDVETPAGYESRWLSAESPDDTALLNRFIDANDEEDLDEAEIIRDQPDPSILVLLGTDGEIAAYASGRPFWAAETTDDVGVLVTPAHRRQGLAAAVVAAFVGQRRHELVQVYRHDVENLGSAAVARAVGFTEVHRVVAYSFDD